MSRYQLSEAYSEIYDYRKIEESFDNLRFVDYLLPEHIEEVIEELVWEFRDYGNTLQESFEMIDYALEDQVICESYDELIADVLYEANPYAPAGSPEARAYQKYTSANKREPIIRRAKRIGEIKNAKRSVMSRMSNLSGPISSVKQANSGSQGGLAKANKSLGGKVVERGKALLKSLLRRGGKSLAKTGKKMMASGTRAAAAPATTRTARVAGRQVTVSSEPTAETGSTRRAVGQAIRKVGKSLKRMGKDKKTSTATTSASEPDDTKTPKSNVLKTRYRITPRIKKPSKSFPFASPGDVVGISKGSDNQKMAKMNPQTQDSDSRAPKGPSKFKSPRKRSNDIKTKSTLPPRSPLPAKTILPQSYSKPITTQKVGGGFDPSEKSSQSKKPKGRQVTSKGVSYSALSRAKATQLGSQQAVARERGQLPRSERVPAGTTGERGVRKVRGGAEYGIKTAERRRQPEPGQATGRGNIRAKVRIREDHLNEILQFISEDLIEAGYTSNLNESYDLIDQMDESTLYDIIQEYLD